MREYLISHGWLLMPAALVGALLLAAGLFVLSDVEQNYCSGFRYFTFVDQRASADGYTMQLINGNMPVMITGFSVASLGEDTSPYVSMENIQPGNAFVVKTGPIGVETGRLFSNMAVSIRYDVINGEANQSDSALCFGKVG